MQVSRITICCWEGPLRHDEIIDRPDLKTIEAAIKRLNAKDVTEVLIDANNDSYLILGGGEGRYVGFVSRSEDEIHNLVNPKGSAGVEIELCVGGQTGFYSQRQLVDLPTAIRAAKTFAEQGELEPTITWERHG